MPNKPQSDDKTGGTPNDGRMAPGAEGRGSEVRQRRPVVEGKLSGEMLKLQTQAFSVSEYLGHAPEIWRTMLDQDAVAFRCTKCGKQAGFALYPPKGKDRINGTIVEERCE
jgi:hypothetical protein